MILLLYIFLCKKQMQKDANVSVSAIMFIVKILFGDETGIGKFWPHNNLLRGSVLATFNAWVYTWKR